MTGSADATARKAPKAGSQPKRTRTPRGQGRGRLLEAFVRLAAREGIDNVTYRSLAKEAGLTSGLASYHFPDRETLLREAVAYAVERSIHETKLSPPEPDLDAYGSNLATFVEEEPWEAAIQYELTVRAWRDPEMRTHLQALYDQYLGATESSLHAAGLVTDPALVRVVFAALDGLVIQQLIFGRPSDTEESIAALRRMLRLLRQDGDGTPSAATPREEQHAGSGK